MGGLRREACPRAPVRGGPGVGPQPHQIFPFLILALSPSCLILYPGTQLQVSHPDNGIQSLYPTRADTRSMIFKWFPLVSCDRQLIKWAIQCFYPGGCNAGLVAVPDGRGEVQRVDPKGGEQRSFCASVESLPGPLPPNLGGRTDRPICPLMGLEAVGQFLSSLLSLVSWGQGRPLAPTPHPGNTVVTLCCSVTRRRQSLKAVSCQGLGRSG